MDVLKGECRVGNRIRTRGCQVDDSIEPTDKTRERALAEIVSDRGIVHRSIPRIGFVLIPTTSYP